MENEKMELGKEYSFAGYKWIPVLIDKETRIAVMQSLGVSAGPWPGYSMSQFGNGDYYTQDISGKDIGDYDEKTRALTEQIKPVVSGDVGLYLPSFDELKNNSAWRKVLSKAAADYHSFGASYYYAWTGTYNGDISAWIVCSDGNTNYDYQGNSYVVPAAFNLDLSKVEIEGDEIKVQVTKASGNSEISAQSLINKLRKQAENSQKLLNLAADAIETYERASAYIHGRFFEGFPVHRQGDDESDSIECPMCKHEVARNDDYPDERPHHCQNCGTKLIY